MSEEFDLLKEIAGRLDKADIAYMVTGSMAMNYYATPRMTRDIDIVAEIKQEDVERLCAIFKRDFYVDDQMIKEAISNEGMFNIVHNKSVIKVDFIIKKKSEYREIEFKRREKIYLDDVPLWIASIEDMILSKLIWAKEGESEMQLKDVKNMLEANQKIDHGYIEKWVTILGIGSLYKRVGK